MRPVAGQARRKRHVGPWLPELLVEDIAVPDPADRVTLDESVSMALLVVLERPDRRHRRDLQP
jgi:RNA polymerase sigma-70 factor, ECF subfamily